MKDRETDLAVHILGTPDPATGSDAAEVVEVRLGKSPAEPVELPPDASLRP